MTVKLISTVQRWQGSANDTKPGSTVETPVGSVYEELGTGNLYRWNGDGWDLVNDPLTALMTQLVELNRQQTVELAVIAGGIELLAGELSGDQDLDLHERFNESRDESDADYQVA